MVIFMLELPTCGHIYVGVTYMWSYLCWSYLHVVIFRSAGESIRPDDGAGRAVRTSKVRDSLTRMRAVNNARTEEENKIVYPFSS